MTTPKLKACPWCGTVPVVLHTSGDSQVLVRRAVVLRSPSDSVLSNTLAGRQNLEHPPQGEEGEEVMTPADHRTIVDPQSRVTVLRAEVEDMKRALADTVENTRNHWRREIAARLWARPDYDDLCPEQVVALADSLLAALEAREKEDGK